MTTRDKLEFIHLMTKYSSASLSDMQRLLRFAAAYQRTFVNGAGRRERIQKRIAHLCAGFDARCIFAGAQVLINSRGEVIGVPA